MAGKVKSNGKKKTEKKIIFEYFAPQAHSVSVASSFNQWDASVTPLRKDKEGKWKARLSLSPGRYEYRYLVDGNWQNAQEPVECVPNAFGTWNCVVEVQ